MQKGWYMDAKYDGKCWGCGEPIEEGDRIGWIPSTKSALCEDCALEMLGEDDESADY